MKKTLLFVVLCAATGLAQAQIKCWTDANGKRACGDAPPPGARVSTLRAPAAAAAPAAGAPAAGAPAAASKGPNSAAEQEQDYRKRQQTAQKAADKAAQEKQEADAKRENCARAQEALRGLEGGRVSRVNASGERYFLDESQVAAETAKARQIAKDSCN